MCARGKVGNPAVRTMAPTRRRSMTLLTYPATNVSTDPALADAQKFCQRPPDELDSLLALTHEADRGVVKLVVPVAAHASTCAALGVDLSRASRRKVYFLDTA